MYQIVENLWLQGTRGNPLELKRQIVLCNQIAVFGVICNVPYQLFCVLYDASLYQSLLLTNLFFMTCYCFVPYVNRRGHYRMALYLALATSCTHVFAASYFMGAGAGVHFFFFSIANVLSLIFLRHHIGMLLAILAALSTLFLFCHSVFDSGAIPVPEHHIVFMFAGSVLGAMALSCGVAYLYHVEIDRAEKRLLESNRALEKLSTTDQLTGLANRRSLDQFLEKEWGRMARSGQPLSMLMCDVDFFKAFNDHYGHQAGDVCLQKVALALQKVVRWPSDLMVRYGGEEFAIVLPQTTEQGARKMAERIRVAVERLQIEHGYSDKSAVVTLSVGGATLAPERNSHWHPLLISADKALYAAKSRGRNCVVIGKQAHEPQQ